VALFRLWSLQTVQQNVRSAPGSYSVLEHGFNRHFFFDCLLNFALIGVALLLMNQVFERTNKVLMKYN